MGQFFETVIVALSDKEWLQTTNGNLSARNCFEPP